MKSDPICQPNSTCTGHMCHKGFRADSRTVLEAVHHSTVPLFFQKYAKAQNSLVNSTHKHGGLSNWNSGFPCSFYYSFPILPLFHSKRGRKCDGTMKPHFKLRKGLSGGQCIQQLTLPSHSPISRGNPNKSLKIYTRLANSIQSFITPASAAAGVIELWLLRFCMHTL